MVGGRMARRVLALMALAELFAGGAKAAPGDWVNAVKPISATALKAIDLPVAPAMGPVPHEGWAIDRGQRLVYNVTRPTLIPVEGGSCKASCPAVILVPGGGFEFLAMDNEGYQVAARLAPLGVRVFILKYRTVALPDSFEGFREAIASTFADKPRPGGKIDIRADLPNAVEDVQAALRAVRSQAAAWKIDPARIGLLGFSAGAVTTLAATQANAPDARPGFIGLIYGPTKTGPVPPHAPPLFAAIAADDRFFGKDGLGLIEDWRGAGASVELHLYSGGGHGFASQTNHTTSDAWFDQYVLWLRAQKILPGT